MIYPTQTRQHITLDATLFRRIFHTFASSFLIYYKLPATLIRFILPLTVFIIVLFLEYLRITKKIDSRHFFGLRGYEHTRPASYLYFGTGMLILLLFTPQPIAIPCILCACFADPLIGELRKKYTKKTVLIIGFLLCSILFTLTWITQTPLIIISVSLIGATGAIIGEVKKFRLIDDDMLIQLIPALLLIITWQVLLHAGINILPSPLIQPI